MSIIVRRPALADVDRLAAINVATWRSAYVGIVPTGYLDAMALDSYRERWVRNVTEGRPGASFFAAELDGRVAAYGICGAYRPQEDAEPEDTDGWGELYAIYTDPPLQGRGLGAAVHEAMLGRLISDGHREAALWVLRDNVSSISWYEARGWRPDGVASTWSGAGEDLPEIRLRRVL